MTYSEGEVIEYVAALLNQTQKLRDEAERYEKVHSMYLFPKLPKDLERDEAVYVLSPDVIHEARETRARILTFDTEIQCLPTERTGAGTVSAPVQGQVDHLEKAGAVFLSRLDPNLDLRSAIIHRQLITPVAIVVLELGPIDSPDPAQRFPWHAFDVDLDGCGWLESRGMPTCFGRRYQQFVFTTEQAYSNRKDGPEGPEARLAWKNGKWDWAKASDDWTPRNMPPTTDSDAFEAAEMVWLDDGERIYQVALDRASQGMQIGPWRIGKSSKRTGKVVWEGPNPFGRVSAFLVGSNITTATLVHDKYLPFYFDLITTTEQENVNASIRATASRNRAAPRDYLHADPEVLKAYMSSHGGEMPPPMEWPSGKTPVAIGELKVRPVDIDPDMDKLDARLQERKQRYASAVASTLSQPDVLKQSTAAAVLAAYDAAAASLSVVVGPLDTFQRQVIEAWEHSVKWLGNAGNSAEGYATGPAYAKFDLRATGKELVSGKTLGSGEDFEITPKSFDVGHEWRVKTHQRSRGQAQAEFAAASERMAPLPDGRPNIGVYDDLFQAAGVSDIGERKVQLAKEALTWETVDPLVNQWVKDSLAFEIEIEQGIRVDLLGAGGASGESAALGGADVPQGEEPNAGLTVNSPVTEPAEGGSGPEFVAG